MAEIKIITDEDFLRWAQSLKPCRYCDVKFVGPCCPRCERPGKEKR